MADYPETIRLAERDFEPMPKVVPKKGRFDDGDSDTDERAQPGDVIGIETGETTELGDTAEDENERRRDSEEHAPKK